MSLELDPRFTFDAFVVGPANRLAAAAARRVADAPGTTYNPLFIYSGSGLGKTHLLTAIGNQIERVHGLPVAYDTIEHLMEGINAAVEAGDPDAFRGRLRDTQLLLLDDVQFLAGQRQVQEELLRDWDALSSRGAQVVLTSDRPPQEIDGLDDRLLSRLSGGLIVDMSSPDFETRVAIARRKADERGSSLSPEVYQALARIAFTNVRELQGALNRLIAVQDLEGREVRPEEVTDLLGAAAERGRDEFGEFLSDITGTVSAVVEEADRRLADALLTWEGEGYRTRRLDSALTGTVTAAQADQLIRRFEQDVLRLQEIERTIQRLDPSARELRSEVLRDPDRVAEAEGLLGTVRDRQVPPPAPPEGPSLDDLAGRSSLAVRAARAVVDAPGTAYNPFYVLGPAGSGRTTLLVAVGNGLRERGLSVGYLEAGAFAEELIGALERSRLDGWRQRYRQADVLIIDDLDELAGMERGQEELFHLFEELSREGGQLVFAAAVPPQELPLSPRLRSRLEAGLVVELDVPDAGTGSDTEPPSLAEAPETDPAGPTEAAGAGSSVPTRTAPAPSPDTPTAAPPDGGAVAADGAGSGASEEGSSSRGPAHWIQSREKVLWEWPYAEDWVEESVD